MTLRRGRARRVGGAPAIALMIALALGGTATGCGSVAAPPGAPPPVPGAPPPGSIRVDGAVTRPTTLDAGALARMPQTDVSVSYQSAGGMQTHQERGVLLVALLPPSALATRPDRKNDQLADGVLAVGADGYQALASYGEISPDFANRGLLVSLAEDGRPLPRPRLVVPGDAKGGRFVSDLVELRVVRAG